MSSGLQWSARGATGGSVSCSWTFQHATNGEGENQTGYLAVAGRPLPPMSYSRPQTMAGFQYTHTHTAVTFDLVKFKRHIYRRHKHERSWRIERGVFPGCSLQRRRIYPSFGAFMNKTQNILWGENPNHAATKPPPCPTLWNRRRYARSCHYSLLVYKRPKKEPSAAVRGRC